MQSFLGLPVGQGVAEAKERGEIAHKAKDSDTYGQQPMKTKHNTARKSKNIVLVILLDFYICSCGCEKTPND